MEMVAAGSPGQQQSGVGCGAGEGVRWRAEAPLPRLVEQSFSAPSHKVIAARSKHPATIEDRISEKLRLLSGLGSSV
jgi:hypothetical protein